MNASELALSPNSFEQRLVSVERGIRLFAITILLLSSVPNLALAFSIQSYTAKIPPLLLLPSVSPLAQIVFGHPYFFIGLAILWPVAGSFITLRAKDPFRAMVASCVYLVLVTLQSTMTGFAFAARIKDLVSQLLSQ
jgi:hypothetical protein